MKYIAYNLQLEPLRILIHLLHLAVIHNYGSASELPMQIHSLTGKAVCCG